MSDGCPGVEFQQSWNLGHVFGYDTLCLGPSRVAPWPSLGRDKAAWHSPKEPFLGIAGYTSYWFKQFHFIFSFPRKYRSPQGEEVQYVYMSCFSLIARPGMWLRRELLSWAAQQVACLITTDNAIIEKKSPEWIIYSFKNYDAQLYSHLKLAYDSSLHSLFQN